MTSILGQRSDENSRKEQSAGAMSHNLIVATVRVRSCTISYQEGQIVSGETWQLCFTTTLAALPLTSHLFFSRLYCR